MTVPTPNVAAAILDQLGSLVEREAASLGDFMELLKQEQQFLSAANAEHLAQALTPLAEQKSAACRLLEDLGRQRQLFLARYGLPLDKVAIESLMASRPALRNTWQNLLDLASQARALNEQNGKLINLRMQHNRGALSVLMAAADRVSVYGPDGHQPSAFGRGRHLGSG